MKYSPQTGLRAAALIALLAAPMLLASMPAAAQTYQGPFPKPSVGCPGGYSAGSPRGLNGGRTDPNTCYPSSSSSPARVHLRSSRSEACPSGMREDSPGSRWCGPPPAVYNPESAARGANLRKPRNDVRCPVGWSSTESRSECWTEAANAPRARVSNGRPCNDGELAEWGVWCTSNYQQLSFRDAERAAIADMNIYYLITNGSLENSTYFSPAATPFFEALNPERRAAAAPAAPAAPLTASGTGSLNPQRRNQVASLCPEGWFGGLAGTARPNPDMCYPGPGALPAYPPQREGEPCAPGHVVSSTWCVNVSGATGTQAANAQGQAQASPNCPPAGNTSTAQQAGAALGGLLGGRRGNAQAGAALGGLLGQAAGGAAQQRPTGCP
jgi:hypothetical protein